jgi:hypothetical protein
MLIKRKPRIMKGKTMHFIVRKTARNLQKDLAVGRLARVMENHCIMQVQKKSPKIKLRKSLNIPTKMSVISVIMIPSPP